MSTALLLAWWLSVPLAVLVDGVKWLRRRRVRVFKTPAAVRGESPPQPAPPPVTTGPVEGAGPPSQARSLGATP